MFLFKIYTTHVSAPKCTEIKLEADLILLQSFMSRALHEYKRIDHCLWYAIVCINAPLYGEPSRN